MENNIKNTKNKLTIMFSVIFFVVIFVFWITFFSAKYFKEVSVEKIEFSNLIKLVDTGTISIDDIMNFWNKFENRILGEKKDKSSLNLPPPNDKKFKPNGFINYVYLDNNSSIVSSNIKDDIDENFIISIKANDKFFESKQESWFLIKKFNLKNNNWTFIMLKRLRYSFSDYISDVLGFLFINILFSLILYFIGLKFVNKAFIPVEENMKDMKEFIDNAGHELKTPISVIDSNIQLMDDMKIYDAQMTKELKNEVLRLNSIIEGLIKLSNIDSLKDLVNNNLNDTINEIIKEFKFKIVEKNLKVEVDVPKNINIKSNKDYFYIFISNIIWNAIKYNNNDWNINIIYKNSELKITDSWIWIDKKDLSKVFDRFFKSDKSRNSEGFGIWLSLVKKIAKIYKWDIDIESKKGKWTSFKIRFL